MNRWKTLLLAPLAISLAAAAEGQTFTVLGSFNGTNGAFRMAVDAQRLDAVRDDNGRRRQRLWQRFQHQHEWHGLQNLSRSAADRREEPRGGLTLSGSTLYG